LEVAATVDRLGDTRDRFVTALKFSELPSIVEMQAMALRECRVFIQSRDFRTLTRWRWPREAPYLLVPAIALALLQWEERIAVQEKRSAAAAAQLEVAGTVRHLEQLARETEKANEQANSEELKKMAEQLKRSAEELRAGATDKTEAEKAALRQLSALEQLVREMEKSPANASAEEMKEVAEALARNDATKDAAAAMQAGKMAEAAKALDDAAQKDEVTAEKAEEALQQALQRLAEKRQLSQQLEQLARRGGNAGQSSRALQQLAEILRQMAQAAEKGQGQKQSTQQALQNLLAALQNLKYGPGAERAGESSDAKNEPADRQVTISSFGSPQPGGDPLAGEAQIPSGLPGSERDVGTTDSPYGKEPVGAGEKGADAGLRGRLGQGESLSQMLPAAGDTSKSNRRYKELFDAMAPAAEDAIVQESIPLGSRFLIRRYFESIRPRE
jgi:hypothetical protein